jgi:hypothetical protein
MKPRQPRRVKKIILAKPGMPRVIKIVPAAKTPVLRYHGIEPEHLVAIDFDVYLPTGHRDSETGKEEYKYKETIFDRRKG